MATTEAGRAPATSATRKTLHVALRGADSSSGAERTPLRTIGAALARAQDGSTVVVHDGVYHESVKIEGSTGITLTAAPRARVWLDGSRPVTSWEPAGSAWVSTGWTAQFDASPTYTWGAPDGDGTSWQFVNPAYPMAAHPDQVWVDDVAQRQVGALAALGPGRFYVDDETDRLYLGTDPTGRDVRASDLAKGLSIRAARTDVRGIGVRRFASSVPHMGTVTVEAPRVRLEDVTIEQNATTGLHVMRSRVRLDHVSLVRNGMMGLTTNGADHLRMNRVRVVGNNRERFNPAPAAGGAKLGRSRDVDIRDSVFQANRGTGLWFDESVRGVTVASSRLSRNAVHGLSLELSGDVVVAGNVIADNGGNGIKVNDTSRVKVWNNTLVGNDREVNIVQDDRDLDSQGSYLDSSSGLTFRNGPVVLANNVLARTGTGSECLLCVEDYSGRFSAEAMKVTANGNIYQRSSSRRPVALVRWSRGDDAASFKSLRAFQRATGQEDRGRQLTDSPAVRRSKRVTVLVARLAAATARPLPRAIARLLGLPTGSRRLGAG
jgi:parallel beta-helix repeat protein